MLTRSTPSAAAAESKVTSYRTSLTGVPRDCPAAWAGSARAARPNTHTLVRITAPDRIPVSNRVTIGEV
jgi:hypothetical protein